MSKRKVIFSKYSLLHRGRSRDILNVCRKEDTVVWLRLDSGVDTTTALRLVLAVLYSFVWNFPQSIIPYLHERCNCYLQYIVFDLVHLSKNTIYCVFARVYSAIGYTICQGFLKYYFLGGQKAYQE